ncbi:MAG: type III pantothenate kinase [Cyanobacteria bacterium]|nr:type III pantothenate kinase [Cyanobacteriota bacterium]
MNPFNLDPLPPRSPAAGPSSPEPLERRERFDRSAFQRDFCQRSEAVAGRWRALLVGNSRWHWATFRRDRLIDTWDGEPWHGELEATSSNAGPIAAASVVPAVTGQLQILAQGGAAIYPIPLAAIPLLNLYDTLGIDRAIALWGAGRVHGFPVLVIDAGTALTLSAADGDRHFLGGAILPGFGLQLRALAEGTAALPPLTVPPDGFDDLPPRFATDTATAILSGVGYGLAAVLRDRVAEWRSRFPTGAVVLTGGDGAALRQFLRAGEELPGPAIALDPHLWRWGLRELVYPEPPRP